MQLLSRTNRMIWFSLAKARITIAVFMMDDSACACAAFGVNDLRDDARAPSTRVVLALTVANTCAVVAVKFCIQREPGSR